jgi:hypothetical protein
MSEFITVSLRPVARACRSVAVGLIGGFRRSMTHAEIEARLAARPLSEQTLIVGATLAALALTSLLFAQFGVVGLLVFFVLVVVLVN